MTKARIKPRYDVQLISDDMGAMGWMLGDLAREADIVPKTLTRFFRYEVQTPKTAKKLARALGRTPEYYLIRDLAAAS